MYFYMRNSEQVKDYPTMNKINSSDIDLNLFSHCIHGNLLESLLTSLSL